MLYRSQDRRRRRVAIKRADAETMQIKAPHMEEKSDNKHNGIKCCTEGRLKRRRKTIKMADTEAIQTKGPHEKEKGGNKEGEANTINGLPMEEEGDNKPSGN